MVPCGTPDIMSSSLDIHPFATTLNFRPLRNSIIHLPILPPIPCFLPSLIIYYGQLYQMPWQNPRKLYPFFLLLLVPRICHYNGTGAVFGCSFQAQIHVDVTYFFFFFSGVLSFSFLSPTRTLSLHVMSDLPVYTVPVSV